MVNEAKMPALSASPMQKEAPFLACISAMRFNSNLEARDKTSELFLAAQPNKQICSILKQPMASLVWHQNVKIIYWKP